MSWNWQLKAWPNFVYNQEKLSGYEKQFLQKAGIMYGSMKHLNNDDNEELTISLMSDEALKTSEIEGEILNRDSLHSSIRRHFGLKTDSRKASPAEYGISEMMVDLYKNFHLPLEHHQLFVWHKMLTNGRRDLKEIGNYRTHSEPMQIVSGVFDTPTVHFEAPPSANVKKEMNEFITWFNQTAPGGDLELPTLTRSGIAHLYFESIHPFEDGNGRIGRAISEKALSQSLARPTLIAIAHTIERKRKNYYAALQRNNRDLEITNWLTFFCEIVLQAQDYTQSMVDFLIEKGKFHNRFAGTLNERQEKVVERVFREGIEGFTGGLSASNYIRITGATRATATRDLQGLVELGAFTRTGQLKHARYSLCIDHPAFK